ncbi:HdeD family acid-resistance protein [Yinghuangia aomiensis]|uniref:HdeD family acid-resistance protein n=1 Tax=Yinghuangia aomiensis TaxID=676205 RepID=A0ABP9I4H2_9ACTN
MQNDMETPPTLGAYLDRVARSAWQAMLVMGIASFALGLIVLIWPGPSLRVVGVLFGVYLLVSGVFQLAAAFGDHLSTAMRILAFISGALSIMLGLFCFRGTLESILLLALWIGIGWLFRGITQVMAAAMDPTVPSRGWQVFVGVVTFLGGIVLLAAPFDSIKVLAIVVGIWLMVVGITEFVTGIALRRHTRHLSEREWQSTESGTRIEG